MKFRCAAVLSLTFVLAAALPVFAAGHDGPGSDPAVASAQTNRGQTPVTLWKVSQEPKRPALLTTMYGTYATLQVLDLMSTRKALAAGASERNPLMGAGNTGRMIAMKAATGALSIYFAEKAWKKNKVGGIVLMAVINSASAAVIAHNMHNARR
jgi:hypothetical protein